MGQLIHKAKGGMKVEIIINGEPKEIAALVLALQERHFPESGKNEKSMENPIKQKRLMSLWRKAIRDTDEAWKV